MSKLNHLTLNLKSAYIFPKISGKVASLRAENPNISLINLGIGDISLPLTPSIVDALKTSAEEMGNGETIRGYGPELGYAFLREKIASRCFPGLEIAPDEVFVSDGITSDLANIRDLLARDVKIGVCNPTYPVYRDTALMQFPEEQIVEIPCLEENGFIPKPPEFHLDVVYLCSPSNPTGVALTCADYAEWIAYAKREKALILLDHAYQPFAQGGVVPHSIFEVEGAKDVAIEFRSFSKGAGFTGLRCGYVTIPKSVTVYTDDTAHSLNPLFARCQEVKTNGVSYPIQRAAEAAIEEEGIKATAAQIAIYREATKTLKEGVASLGYTVFGGDHSPYVWVKAPNGMSSWEFFDHLLYEKGIISIPGSGFGSRGEGYVRFSGFNEKSTIEKALQRLKIEEVCHDA